MGPRFLKPGRHDDRNFHCVPYARCNVKQIHELSVGPRVLPAGVRSAVQVELLGIDLGLPFYVKQVDYITMRTTGLGVPSIEVEYKITGDHDTGAFQSSFQTYTLNVAALKGNEFPANSTFYTMDLRFVEIGDASNNVYGILFDAELSLSQIAGQNTDRPAR